jgi:hypothetical protein
MHDLLAVSIMADSLLLGMTWIRLPARATEAAGFASSTTRTIRGSPRSATSAASGCPTTLKYSRGEMSNINESAIPL